jgi:hypothetical protein
VDVIFLVFLPSSLPLPLSSPINIQIKAKSSNWEFKLNAKQYTDIISLTLTDLFVNVCEESKWRKKLMNFRLL